MLTAAGNVVKLSDPSDLSLFMPCELAWSFQKDYRNWVFWSRDNNELKRLVQSDTVEASSQSQAIKGMIKYVLQNVCPWCDGCLIQFWAPLVIGDRTFLTIADQPFLLTNLHSGLCSYRKHCLDCLLPVDDDQSTVIGPPARVFRRGLPEFCTSLYRNEDFSLPDIFLSIGVKFYAAVPLFMPPFYRCVGVLEILAPWPMTFFIRHQILRKLEKKFNLISCDNKYGFSNNDTLAPPKQIPGNASVADVCNLLLICHDGPKIGEFYIWHPGPDAIWIRTMESISPVYAKKGEGPAGRAFASQSACFCMDITQLSINEHPLLPIARQLGCSASFAICLQNRYASDELLVLELFLHLDGTSCEDPKTYLTKLLVEMKSIFKHLRAASSGDELFIEVIKTSALDQLESFEIRNPFTSENSAAEHAQFLEGIRELPQIDHLLPEQIEYETTGVLADETDTSLLLERAKRLLRGNKESAENNRENSPSSSSSSSVCNYEKFKVFGQYFYG